MTSAQLHEFADIKDALEKIGDLARGYSLKSAWHAAVVGACIGAAILLILCASSCGVAHAQEWTATGYCPCQKCCLKNDGITASGQIAREGITAAVNWLPFGTPIKINGKTYLVQDRGARSIFGSKKHHKKRVDIFFASHKQALRFGRQKVDVQI